MSQPARPGPSAEAADCLASGETDGLVLNYARGFVGDSIDVLDGSRALRRPSVLDRSTHRSSSTHLGVICITGTRGR